MTPKNRITADDFIRRCIAKGGDPRSYRQGLASSLRVEVSEIDAVIDEIGVPDEKELDRRTAALAYAHPDEYRDMYTGLDHDEDGIRRH